MFAKIILSRKFHYEQMYAVLFKCCFSYRLYNMQFSSVSIRISTVFLKPNMFY